MIDPSCPPNLIAAADQQYAEVTNLLASTVSVAKRHLDQGKSPLEAASRVVAMVHTGLVDSDPAKALATAIAVVAAASVELAQRPPGQQE